MSGIRDQKQEEERKRECALSKISFCSALGACADGSGACALHVPLLEGLQELLDPWGLGPFLNFSCWSYPWDTHPWKHKTYSPPHSQDGSGCEHGNFSFRYLWKEFLMINTKKQTQQGAWRENLGEITKRTFRLPLLHSPGQGQKGFRSPVPWPVGGFLLPLEAVDCCA